MLRVNYGQLGIVQGSELLFSDFEEGGAMWAQEGDREVRIRVVFETPFVSAPIVHLALSMVDVDTSTNYRADLSAIDKEPDGFTILFQTWDDTKIARIRADWVAFGPVPDEDNWNV